MDTWYGEGYTAGSRQEDSKAPADSRGFPRLVYARLPFGAARPESYLAIRYVWHGLDADWLAERLT